MSKTKGHNEKLFEIIFFKVVIFNTPKLQLMKINNTPKLQLMTINYYVQFNILYFNYLLYLTKFISFS